MTMIALGGIVGAGLFVGSGTVVHAAGPAAIVAYMIGGLLVVIVMRMLAEMATAQPARGSFAEYARVAIGDGAGFVVGWTYWYFWVVVIAFEAVAGAKIIHSWVPAAPLWVTALLIMGVMTAVNLLSVRAFGEMEFWFASIKIIAILAFLIVGALWAAGALPSAHGHVPAPLHEPFAPSGASGFLHALIVVVFSYFGAEIVTIAAAESAEPTKAIARATVSIVWRVIVFYVGTVAVIVAVVPWTQVPTDTSPFVTVLDRIGIPGAGPAMQVIILTAVLSLLNSGIYTASRMLFALTERGEAPSFLAKSSRRGAPVRAILLCTTIGWISVILAVVSPDGVFSLLLNAAGAVALVIYAAIAVSQLRMRRRLERTAPEGLQVRMWAFPLLTWATIAALAGVVIAMAVLPEDRSQLLFGLIAPAAAVLAHLIRRAVTRFRNGPRAHGTADDLHA
ncbi:amino acid permease [Actinomadura nitritigenes]|uniref:amino acid permease n=1 Tax=Actinomadura nitritigenes TaxID=134602 RepID=UPI003D90990C